MPGMGRSPRWQQQEQERYGYSYSYGLNGTLEEYLPATTFGAPASATAGHGGWREVARNRQGQPA